MIAAPGGLLITLKADAVRRPRTDHHDDQEQHHDDVSSIRVEVEGRGTARWSIELMFDILLV
jgi:hypothetical protein